MRQRLKLPFQFPSLNEYISAMNRHRMKGNAMKQEYTDDVALMCKAQKLKPYSQPIELAFFFTEKRANRDPDNIVAFARKCILDGMQVAGIIPNDNQKYIKRWTDEWAVGPNPGVLVIIEEWKDDRKPSTLGSLRAV